MALNKKSRLTFNAIIDAAGEHRLCLVECDDRRTGKKVPVLCESWTEDGVVRLNPLGRLFSGSPFNEVAPPGVDAPKLI